MGRIKRIWYEGAIYHVMQRGVGRMAIFPEDEDKHRFLRYMKKRVIENNCKVHAYCIMTNHFHILVETADIPIWKLMATLEHDYSMYYNRYHEREGTLFQNRYKAKIVDNNAYFLQVSRYINLNPVAAGMVLAPEEYRWSSYRTLIGDENDKITTYQRTLSCLFYKTPKEYRCFVENKDDKLCEQDDEVRRDIGEMNDE